MKSGLFIWTLIALVILFFFYLLPLPLRNEYVVTWAILGGIICFILILIFFSTREEHSPILKLQLPLYLSSFFLFGALLIYFTTKAVEYEFEHNYEVSMGYLHLWSGTTAEVDEQTKVHINYSVKDSRSRFINAYVTWRQLDLESFNRTIPVVYSKDYPDLAKLILGIKSRKKYGVDFTDTLSKVQVRVLKAVLDRASYFNHGLYNIKDYCKRNGLTEEDTYTILQHIEPVITLSKSGSGKGLKVFATIMSVIFLIIKLVDKLKQ